jgi:hypothetical protein
MTKTRSGTPSCGAVNPTPWRRPHRRHHSLDERLHRRRRDGRRLDFGSPGSQHDRTDLHD